MQAAANATAYSLLPWLDGALARELAEALFQCVKAVSFLSGNREDLLFGKSSLEGFEVKIRLFEIDFVRDDQPRALTQFFVIETKLFSKDLDI